MYIIMTPMDAPHYPGASLISPTTVAFDADDYGDVLRFFYFVI